MQTFNYCRTLFYVVALFLLMALKANCQTLQWGDGVNLQPSYYNSGDVNLGWSLMNQQSKIQTVRLEIEPQNGDGDSAPTIATVQRWISEAIANNKNVICTYHNWQHNGSDDVNALNAAANWWRTNYAALRQAGPFTVNLMNEWGSHSQTPSTFASAYNNAISIVRQVYSGPIIVDIPGWAQETQVAYEARNMITDNNFVYSVHIYGSAYVQYGPARWMTNADLDVLGNSGKPVIVGEFGSLQSGGADWSGLVDHARSKGWTLIGWAWNGDGTGMNMVTPYWGDNPSATSFTTSSYFGDVYNKLRTTTTTPTLTVSTTSLSFGASASSQNVSVTSNTSWSVTSNQSWITVSPSSGTNNGTFAVSVSANSGTSGRTGTITVAGGGITRSISVSQGAGSSSPNLALNKPATISSTDGYAGGGAQAVDGNLSTRWASAWSDPQWIYIDLQATYNVNRIVLNWEAAYGRSYQLQVSNDASNWTTIYSTTTGDGGTDDVSVSGTGRYVRMYGTARATSYGYSLWELQVYGTPATTSPSNLALNKTTTVSSSESANYGGAKAVDGNSSTRWASALNPSSAQWIRVDLGSTQNIGRVKIVWEAAYATNYQIQTSNNGSAWTTIKSVTGNSSLTNDHTGLGASARYVRVYCTARVNSNWGYSIFELEVYGSSSARLATAYNQEESFEEFAEVSAYPNPVEGKVTVSISERYQANGKIALMNQFGSTLISDIVQGSLHSFDMSNMSTGLYFVQVQNPKGKSVIKIFKK